MAEKLHSDTEKIIDLKNRKGILGFIFGGRDGMNKNLTKIKRTENDPSNYDLVILGTPIWVGLPPAMRTYLNENKNSFKKVAFFCTMGGSKWEELFLEMENIVNKKPLATMAITTAEVKANKYFDHLNRFIKGIK